jgi:hypothetical protein
MVALARKGVVQRPDIVKIFAENEFIPIGSATPEGISRLVRIVTVKRR